MLTQSYIALALRTGSIAHGYKAHINLCALLPIVKANVSPVDIRNGRGTEESRDGVGEECFHKPMTNTNTLNSTSVIFSLS